MSGTAERKAIQCPCTSSKVVPDTVGTTGDAMCSGERQRCEPGNEISCLPPRIPRANAFKGSAWRARSPCARSNPEYIHRNAQKITERSVPHLAASQIKLLCPSAIFCGCNAVLRESKTKITLTTDFTDATDDFGNPTHPSVPSAVQVFVVQVFVNEIFVVQA